MLVLLLGLAASPWAAALDLQQLAARLQAPAVVRGAFVQEKHLRALPQPLVSRGHYVLARGRGLLWFLETPLRQDYRITLDGIARRQDGAWQATAQQGAAARQNQLSLALLSGDSAALQRDFELDLQGGDDAWTLTLTPRALLLRQIFQAIRIQGGERVEQVELLETQGDRTLLRMPDSRVDATLSEAERHDFAD
nr:outer membrane lipoprotein carrier protein LolA [Pseudomonas sp. RIT-PI-AD]